MSQQISLWGADYSNVPSVDLPKTGGGTARFVDTTDANAQASDILSGKTAYVNNVKITGTGSGGGGTYQAKTNINPSTSSQTITPDSGYDALSSVQINAMPSGSVSASATKGAVSNHSISVTPKATVGTAGYLAAGNTNGTPVTVQASELVSGNLALTDNTASTDCTNYATVSVAIPFVTYYTSSSSPASSQGNNGDIWLVTTA